MLPKKSIPVLQAIAQIVFGLIALIIVFTAIGVLLKVFSDKKIDTTSLTNIGFAMAVSMASVCFSWLKIFKADEHELIMLRIQLAGQEFLLAAGAFSFSSFLKYTDFHQEFLPSFIRQSNLLYFIYHSGFYTALTFSIFAFVDGVVSVLSILIKNHWKDMKNYASKKKSNSQ